MGERALVPTPLRVGRAAGQRGTPVAGVRRRSHHRRLADVARDLAEHTLDPARHRDHPTTPEHHPTMITRESGCALRDCVRTRQVGPPLGAAHRPAVYPGDAVRTS